MKNEFNSQFLWSLVLSVLCMIGGMGPIHAQTDAELLKVYPNSKMVRVMAYKIWGGFEWQKDVDRMKRTAEWIKKQDPEVIAFEELNSFDEKALLEFAKMYGHSYAVIQKTEGCPVGITSKRPIEVVKKYCGEDMWHGFLHVRTYGMDMIVLHLTPFSCNYRLNEARKLTDYVRDNNLERCLLMGDFNAHSPYDAEELDHHTEMIQWYSTYAQQYPEKSSVHGKNLDYAVMSEFYATPLEDPIRNFVPVKERMTYPSFTFSEKRKGKNTLEHCGERIDYILATYSLYESVVDAHVWNGEENRYFSDHYPVGIDLLLDNKLIKGEKDK